MTFIPKKPGLLKFVHFWFKRYSLKWNCSVMSTLINLRFSRIIKDFSFLMIKPQSILWKSSCWKLNTEEKKKWTKVFFFSLFYFFKISLGNKQEKSKKRKMIEFKIWFWKSFERKNSSSSFLLRIKIRIISKDCSSKSTQGHFFPCFHSTPVRMNFSTVLLSRKNHSSNVNFHEIWIITRDGKTRSAFRAGIKIFYRKKLFNSIHPILICHEGKQSFLFEKKKDTLHYTPLHNTFRNKLILFFPGDVVKHLINLILLKKIFVFV